MHCWRFTAELLFEILRYHDDDFNAEYQGRSYCRLPGKTVGLQRALLIKLLAYICKRTGFPNERTSKKILLSHGHGVGLRGYTPETALNVCFLCNFSAGASTGSKELLEGLLRIRFRITGYRSYFSRGCCAAHIVLDREEAKNFKTKWTKFFKPKLWKKSLPRNLLSSSKWLSHFLKSSKEVSITNLVAVLGIRLSCPRSQRLPKPLNGLARNLRVERQPFSWWTPDLLLKLPGSDLSPGSSG